MVFSCEKTFLFESHVRSATNVETDFRLHENKYAEIEVFGFCLNLVTKVPRGILSLAYSWLHLEMLFTTFEPEDTYD